MESSGQAYLGSHIGTEVPSGFQRQSPGKRSGDEVPQKLLYLDRIAYKKIRQRQVGHGRLGLVPLPIKYAK